MDIKHQIPSECEIQTMVAIYDLSKKGISPALSAIVDYLNDTQGHNWKSQTVSTFIARLVKKGYVSSTREGRHIYHNCTMTKKEFLQKYLEYSAEILSNGDLEELRSVINEL